MHEDAALMKIGGDAKNLNGDAAHKMRGGQYPTFDISSSKEICSVKSHISQAGGPTQQDLAAYKTDFSHMLGWGRAYENGISPKEQDAERIAILAKQGTPIPGELKEADTEQVASYLQNKSIMRVPENHVDEVRDFLAKDVRKNPENYFLPPELEPTDEQVQAIANRIQGTGLTSDETLNRLNTQQEHLSDTPANVQLVNEKFGDEVENSINRLEMEKRETTMSKADKSAENSCGSSSESEDYPYGVSQ
jgi:hypothetical protein